MVTFTRPVEAVHDLYVSASSTGGDGGWLGYVLPNAPTELTSLPLGQAFGAQGGSFVFASSAPTLAGEGAATLVANVEALLADGVRRCVWLRNPDQVSAATTVAFGFDAGAGTLRIGAQVAIGANLVLNVVNGSGIDAPQDALVLSQGRGGAAPVSWDGSSALTGGLVSSAAIPCAGPQRGCVTFAQDVDVVALNNHLSWGFQTAIADASAPSGTRIGWYPLADASAGGQVALAVAVDPTDPFNAGGVERTAFAFTDRTTSLASGYRTSAGWVVTLAPVTDPGEAALPARLWLHASAPDANAKRDFVACPVGDFVLGVKAPQGATAAPALLCGLSGTETVTFTAGDTMRFKAQCAAFAPRYPYPPASPVAAPVQPTDAKLDTTYLTSWGSLVTATGDGGHYSAQPKGASLYQKPTNADAGVLLFAEPGMTLAAGAALPLLPYALVAAGTGATYSMAQYADVETKVVAAARRGAASAKALGRAAAAPAALAAIGNGDGGTKPATTPAGLVVQVDQSTGAYTRVDLAQDVTRDPAVTMALTQPSDAMHEALQTSQLFLVKANADKLGTLAGWPPTAPAGSAFYNAMTIGDWALLADVGTHAGYGDYANVMIVKGRRGKLRDLVRTPDVWTQPTLAIPSGETGDPSELTALSQWLDDYFATAANETSDYFTAFNAIVEDETWTGVLVLKAVVAAVPPELTGMLGGVDRELFNAHHFGFTITKVDPATVAMSGNSATFGLIYYVDPAFDATQSPPQPVPPASQPWDFKVLTLKALFANASVERFESYAQLTLGELFGQPVDHMGGPGANPYDALILTGSLHKQGSRTTYGLEALGDSTFFFDGGVINKAEVLQADFSTTAQEPQEDGSTRVSSRFDLFGFLDFRPLSGDAGVFDVFSFGSSESQPDLKGLSVSGLGVTMTFDEPADPTKASSPPSYAFDVSKVTFDGSRSTPRDASLTSSLGLQVAGLVTGDKDTPPSSLGYVDVGTPLRLPGVRGDWYGLKLQANFGSPGALAGKVGLTSYVLLAWSPPSGPSDAPAAVGLLLPGAGQGSSLLSLQGVMKLAVGPVLLTLVPTKSGGKAFMLAISEIALKFLGLLKLPPSGATAFYLFGDTTGNDGPLGWFALYKGPDPPAADPPAPALTTGATG